MNLNNFNSLIELFFYQSERQNPKSIFLEWLNPNNRKNFSWAETKQNIFKLSKKIKKIVKEGDRCLLVSENRPEWFISDLAIMLAGGITVPAYTTYTEEDYKYLIEDCEPTLVIVSNKEMLNKLKKIPKKKKNSKNESKKNRKKNAKIKNTTKNRIKPLTLFPEFLLTASRFSRRPA